MNAPLPPESDEPTPVPPPEITAPGLVTPSLMAMTLGFTTMTMQGVGGVLVFARRYIVERARWMTAQEFDEAFAFSQLLPGPNIVNFAVMYGQRALRRRRRRLRVYGHPRAAGRAGHGHRCGLRAVR